MKNLLLILLISATSFAQKKVYNVQEYCIDQKPFAAGSCDIRGNEYSFVFVDEAKKDVTLFLAGMKMPFRIESSALSQVHPQYRVFTLADEKGSYEMRVNKTGTKMEFHMPDNRIYLTVGASTKLVR